MVSSLVLGLLVALGPTATAAPSRAELVKRADTIAFKVSLKRFMKIYRGDRMAIDASFDWADYDGCSLPNEIKPLAAKFVKLFRNPCLRHDFGYRNFGNGLALGSDESHKSAIDSKFYADMKTVCGRISDTGDRGDCNEKAYLFYFGVSRFGKAQTAFYKSECAAKRLCLFDDAGYEDRRLTLKSSEDDMNDVDFGDKTSSVMNRTGRAWVLYDDNDYEDRAFCIPPGVSVRDFGIDSLKFNDKTSSAKRLSSEKCPKGIAQIN